MTIPAPPDDLRDLLTRASGGPPTVEFAAFYDKAMRRRRNRRIAGVVAVAVCVAAVAIIVPIVAAGGGSQRAANPGPGSVSPSPVDTHRETGLLAETVVASSASRLVLEAPGNSIRWILNKDCGVSYRYLSGPVNAGGSAGPGCPFASHLSVGATGSFGGTGKLFDLLGGRVSPARGVTVKVTLVDGQTMSYTPQQSYWLAVDQRCGNYTGTAFKSVSAVTANGTVLARQSIPAEPTTGTTATSTPSPGVVEPGTAPNPQLICEQAHHAPSSSSTPSAARTTRETVAQAVLGERFALVDAGPLRFGTSVQAGSADDQEQEWKAPNGDEANITWQKDNITLDHAAPPTARTAAGNRYEIQHAQNGSVQIIMYSNGNAILYSRIDPNVNPNKRRHGVLISDVPNDRTLIRQATRLLTAS
jgi:hypothetical protein